MRPGKCQGSVARTRKAAGFQFPLAHFVRYGEMITLPYVSSHVHQSALSSFEAISLSDIGPSRLVSMQLGRVMSHEESFLTYRQL